MKRILTCRVCGKQVKVNRYKIDSENSYACAKCRGASK